MHPDQILELLRRHAFRSRESLQIAERLKTLLPQVLQTTKRNLNARWKGAEADRHALNDPSYLQKVNEYVEIYHAGLEARVQYETHRMLLQAWQSLNSLAKVQLAQAQKLKNLPSQNQSHAKSKSQDRSESQQQRHVSHPNK